MFVRRATIICGPNGCGKTSDLKAFYWGNKLRQRLIPENRHLPEPGGYARQGRLIGFLAPTVIGALASTLLFSGTSYPKAIERSNAILDAAHLLHLRNRSFRYLSGGEAQIVNLLCAIVGARHTVLMDDPFSMLDDLHRAAIVDIMSRLEGHQLASQIECTDLILTQVTACDESTTWVHAVDKLELALQVDSFVRQVFGELVQAVGSQSWGRNDAGNIELERLTLKTNRSRELFTPITATFEPGTHYLLRARNGAGKSLLLGAMAGHASNGLLNAAWRYMRGQVGYGVIIQGSLRFGGSHVPIFVPQHCELSTADEGPKHELGVILKQAGIGDRLLFKVMGALGVTGKRIGEYSLGEARFLSAIIGILTAIATPEVGWLFLDEVDARLDEERGSLVRNLIQIFIDSGGGVIEASHLNRKDNGKSTVISLQAPK